MKKMPKNLLDELIKQQRAYWKDGEDNINLIAELSQEIGRKTGLCFTSPWNLVCDIIKPSGFYPDADNEIIYSALRALGWEVVADVNELN